MVYNPTIWENYKTPISAENLNNMEQGISNAAESINELNEEKQIFFENAEITINECKKTTEDCEEAIKKCEDAASGVVTIEQSRGRPLKFWADTKEKYNALVESGNLDDDTFYILIDEQPTDYIYVEEQGMSNGWTYRKWSSGIAECWGKFAQTNLLIQTQKDDISYTSDIITTMLPENLFKTVTYGQVEIIRNNDTAYFSRTANITTTQIDYYALRIGAPTSNVIPSVPFYINIKGTWK